MRAKSWLTTLTAFACGSMACARATSAGRAEPAVTPLPESVYRGSPGAGEPGATDRNAAQLVGSATEHLDKCELDAAGKDVERAIALYQQNAETSDAAYARALIARGRLRQLLNDDATATPDFDTALAILAKHERENLVLLLHTSSRLADCYRDPETKQEQRAVVERGLEVAVRVLVPLAKAKPSEVEGYSSALALIEQYDLVGEKSLPPAWDAKFRVSRWKWGEAWEGPLSPSPARRPKGQPQCQPPDMEPVSDAEVVVGALRQQFRRCYNDALAKGVMIQGGVRIAARVVADGSVRSVRGLSIGLPGECNDCITRAVAGARFKPPSGGSATIEIPITYAVEPTP